MSATSLLTISGLPGSGTTTVGRLVARERGCAYHSSGEVFRAAAGARGVSLAEFGRLAEGDDSIDRALDRRVVELMRGGGMVMEGRLTGWLAFRNALASFRVWLAASREVRLARVMQRDGGELEAKRESMRRREASERKRYLAYYGYDLEAMTPYNLVLDTAAATPEQLAARIMEVQDG